MEQTIPKLMRKAAQKYPEITAQYSRTKTGDFEERNYHDMLQFALDFAGGLAELGVVRGEKIGLI
ncbi:MAG: long-chain fatty acid--CoA ligase, partial [Treponema sp.]|nr:long-chain fatty acid--CoA ligase [Treponema sp.]